MFDRGAYLCSLLPWELISLLSNITAMSRCFVAGQVSRQPAREGERPEGARVPLITLPAIKALQQLLQLCVAWLWAVQQDLASSVELASVQQLKLKDPGRPDILARGLLHLPGVGLSPLGSCTSDHHLGLV